MAEDPKQLSEENKLLKERNKFLEEGYSLSTSYLDSLKEILGIQSKLSQYESDTLDVNKQLQKSIKNQNTDLNSIAEKSKEIAKNDNLVAKANLTIQSLSNSISSKKKEQVDYAKKQIDLQNSLTQKIVEELKKAETGEKINTRRLAGLKGRLAQQEQLVEKEIESLNPLQKQLLFTELSNSELEKQNKLRKKELDTLKDIDKTLGATGKFTELLGKIPGLGKYASDALGKVEEKIKKASEAGEKIPSRFKAMGMVLKEVGGGMKEFLTDPLTIGLAAGAGLVKMIGDIDKMTTGTARNFGISKGEANDLNKELSGIARSSNDNFVTTKKLNESFSTLNDRYGTFADFSDATLVTFTELTKKAGISAEAVGALQDTTFLTGKNLKETTSEYEGQIKALKAQTGLAINEKQVLEGIKNVSAATKLQLGGSAEAIATAVFKAKALGMELKDLASISDSLLNFQSSIENELSAELMTGKQLNLEGARYAALIGDQAMLADELAKNVGSAADFQKMNVLQQDALAKSLGLSRDTLAETLMQREALTKLGAKDGETQKEAYDRLVEQYGVEEARKRIGDESLAKQMESVSMQEKFASITEKLQEAFIPLAEALLPIVDGFASIVSHATLLKTVLGVIGGVVLGNMAAGLGQSIAKMTVMLGLSTATAAAETAGATALTFGAILPVILGSVGAIVGLISGLTSANDLFSPGGGYGKRTLLAPEGAFALNDNDNIVATTNPINANDLISKPKGAINVAPQQVSQRSEIKVAPSNTQIAINLDGAALGNASARSNYSVGSNIKSLGGKVDYSAPI